MQSFIKSLIIIRGIKSTHSNVELSLQQYDFIHVTPPQKPADVLKPISAPQQPLRPTPAVANKPLVPSRAAPQINGNNLQNKLQPPLIPSRPAPKKNWAVVCLIFEFTLSSLNGLLYVRQFEARNLFETPAEIGHGSVLTSSLSPISCVSPKSLLRP